MSINFFLFRKSFCEKPKFKILKKARFNPIREKPSSPLKTIRSIEEDC